jgi:hypothetical protein
MEVGEQDPDGLRRRGMERPPSTSGAHRGPRAAYLAAAASLALLAAGPRALRAQEADPPPNIVYEFQVALAPVCLDGTFPFRLELVGGYVEGTLDVATDVNGALSGTLAFGPTSLDVTGKVKYRDHSNRLHLVAKGDGERLVCEGQLYGSFFAGNVVGHGDLAPGKNTFALDLADALASTADVTVVIPPGEGKKLEGAGSALVCGDALEGTATRTGAAKLSLDVRAGRFRWTGSGPVGGDPQSALVAWKARGYGALITGEGMGLDIVPPPSGISYPGLASLYEAEESVSPVAPVSGGGPVVTWSVTPDLPSGLSLDAQTGTFSGVPAGPTDAADYTVKAENLAGSATVMVNFSVRLNRAYSFAAEARTLTDDDLRYFLGRTHFGVKASELASVKSMGLAAYVDDMLDFRSGTAVEASAFAELVNPTDPPNLQGGFPNGYQISRWWERIMIETDRPFQECMAFFWHDHMPCSWEVLGGGYTHFEVNYVNLLRHQGSGNLRDLLLAMARDEGMLIYLSGYTNNRYTPNENFAREFWELFTLGVDNGYTQQDILQAAKAFTGYQIRYNGTTGQYYMAFTPSLHDPNSKTFLGTTIPGQNVTDDYASVVDTTLANGSVAEYLTKKIFEYFCYEDPPQSLVDAMAAVLRAPGGADNPWDLKPFLKSLFTSEAFLSRRSQATRVKSPVEYTVGLIRSTGLKIRYSDMDAYLAVLGHEPGYPPTVNGWPLGTLWYAASAMINRTNLTYTIVNDTARQAAQGINVASILPPVAQRTDAAVLTTLEDLFRVDLTASEEAELITYLNTVRQANGSVVPSAFDGSSQAQLDERVRGLIYILATHPSFQVK